MLRARPPEPGLLEPYDLEQQFRILRALEPTPVRSPKVYWYEGTGEVLGRQFYVMERLGGTVYEQGVPGSCRRCRQRIAADVGVAWSSRSRRSTASIRSRRASGSWATACTSSTVSSSTGR